MRQHLAAPLHRPLSARVELVFVVVFICLFALIAEGVVSGSALTQLDLRVLHWFDAHRTAALTSVMMAVSLAHEPACVSAASLVLAAWLWSRRDRVWAVAAVAAIDGGMVLNTAVKIAFHRARPVLEHPVLALHSYSFPSGHTAAATLLWGFVCAMAWSKLDDARAPWLVCAAAAAMVALVAISRMYLGAHFLSDVLAAFAEAAAWLALVLSVVRVLEPA
jgi:undecaprenyl-diphosphatase